MKLPKRSLFKNSLTIQFMETVTIHNISHIIPYCEAKGLAKVFNAYADSASREDILEGGIGFNAQSGYVYLALENGITFCSAFGREVEFIINDHETEEETFFSSYQTAIEEINK